MTRRLSSEEKLVLVKRYLLGERIALISREINVSRTMIYRWIYLYKDNKEYKFKSLFNSQLCKGRKHYRKISLKKEMQIVSCSLRNPSFSIRKLAAISGVSHHYVWSVLKKRHLSTVAEKLSQAALSPKIIRLSPADKITMIRRFEAGEKVSKICRDFCVSRTIFYRWLKMYNATPINNRDFNLFNRINVHYRYLPEVSKLATDIVVLYPRLSIRRIREEMIKRIGSNVVSRYTIYKVLRDKNLNSKAKRIVFSNIFMPTVTDYS